MLASTLVVDFRADPQRRAAVWLRWPSAQSAKVELQDFNLERERTDDRREISGGRATSRTNSSIHRSRGLLLLSARIFWARARMARNISSTKVSRSSIRAAITFRRYAPL